MEFEELSTKKLIELALNEEDEDTRWKYIIVLHLRGTKEVFDAAESLCKSSYSKTIELGADILGQLGSVELPFKKESLPILLDLATSKLQSSGDEDKLDAFQSVIIALGKMNDETARKKILEFTNHFSEDIRFAVVHGLLTIDEEPEIKALIELSADRDEDVRNWATFGLGSQIDSDSKGIRDALFDRLNEVKSDLGQEIRGEALVGLARRKDARVIEPLLKQLAGESVGRLDVEAASEFADERFCKVLLELSNWWDLDKTLLAEAIKNCCRTETEDQRK